jgi:peptidoglycan hydrolase-like protein with peptidoglycan-binding domain
MVTLQARFMLVAFVILAAAITYNATYLQNGPHPAPITADGQKLEVPAKRSDRESPRVARTLPRHTETTASLPRSKTVLAIQRRLSESGYEPGPVDGILGQMTRAAIMAYQHDNGFRITGEASDHLLKSMILGTSPDSGSTGANVSIPEETTELVKAVQKTLADLGYDPGPADGLWGSATGKAIRKFEGDRKLPVKGRISGRLVKELMDANRGQLGLVVSG